MSRTLFNKKSPEERKALLRQNMMVQPIMNVQPEYQRSVREIQQEEAAQQPVLMTVNLMQLRLFDGNPRKTKNPKFDEIKESIRMRGLDFAPNITKRPGDDYYIIADGGNTRLQALNELWTETQDPKFWTIRCLYKPWKTGEENEGMLHCLIGHLAENDLRGDLSFIERALAIAEIKALYERQEKTFFSHRQLAERLKQDGYVISHVLLFRMEQCLDYLYPAIPTILLSGMGKPQIEKIISLRTNAETFWKNQGQDGTQFNAVFTKALSPFDDEPQAFHLGYFQDELIGAMVSVLNNGITYEEIRFEIDLDAQKHRRKEEKAASKTAVIVEQPFRSVSSDSVPEVPAMVQYSGLDLPDDVDMCSTAESDLMISNTDKVKSEPITNHVTIDKPDEAKPLDEPAESPYAHLLSQFGMTPGLSLREQHEKRAKENGLTFANTGSQPVTDIWQIFPAFDTAKKLSVEVCGLAFDLLHAVGFNPKKVIQPLETTLPEKDFSFTVDLLPAEDKGHPLKESIYQLVCMVADDQHSEALSWTLDESLLLGQHNAPEMDDLLLVKIFRLLRVTRQMRVHQRQISQ
ncbi:hypothetical protein A1D23_12970 [Chelonobacter oris]|uniref:ParB family protein n=1 Tax=Chelonobacter oris TaxID=505317 RepID=UPI00244A313F|nr:ParB family protein [Chelonobacter oris]MDH3001451.1 hypothetical protein [Chelonobacter oris]